MVTQTCTIHIEAHGELKQRFKLVQNVAAQKHSVAFLQLEGIHLFHTPSWMLSYAPGRFQPTFIQTENPNLQGCPTEQVLSLSIKGCIPWGLSSL